MARKRKSKPTSKARSRKQSTKDRYAHAREDAQLEGLIPTSPEEALKPERVDPSSQSEQKIPSLDRLAVVNDGKGWAVPEHVKQKVVERLAEPFFEEGRMVVDKEGNRIVLPPDRYLLKENAKTLITADQKQYERNNPEQAGKAKGGTNVEVKTQVVIDPYEMFKRMLAEQDTPAPPDLPGGKGETVAIENVQPNKSQ